MSGETLQTLDQQYIANTYARFDVAFVRGKGCYLYDEAGKSYIDMGSGIAVSGLGHGDKAWEKAVCGQATTPWRSGAAAIVVRMVASSTDSARSAARSAASSANQWRRRSKLLGAPTSMALAMVATLAAGA